MSILAILKIQTNQSEPFILFSIFKCAWRPNFTFFGIFLLFIKPLWKSLIWWFKIFYSFLLFTAKQQFSKIYNTINLLYIYIYRDGLWCIAMHGGVCALDHKSLIQNSNDRSKPFILFSILICAWRPNFTFFWKFFTIFF